VHDADRARTRDLNSDTTIRATPPNQSSQNPQVMERDGGPSYTLDQLPRPLPMSEGAGCIHGMATGPFDYCTIRAHVTPDIPPPLPERREIGAFLLRPGFKPATLSIMWALMVQ
jgi:hypothetical protein